MISVLFVCTGNICRSPIAEGVFRNLIEEKSLTENFLIDSAGTHEYHIGKPPDQRAVTTVAKKKIDISWQRARHIEDTDFEAFDYILAMDNYNIECLLAVCPEQYKNKIKLLLDYAGKIKNKEVPDPYYDKTDGFNKVYELIFKASNKFLEEVIKKI